MSDPREDRQTDIEALEMLGAGGPQGSWSGGFYNRHQYGIIYDLIAEGEIDGLVDGMSSIYLNETPLIDSSKLTTYGPRQGRITTTNASTTITSVAYQGKVATDLLSGITLGDGDRYISIEGAGPTSTTSGTHYAKGTELLVNDAIFTAAMATSSLSGPLRRYITIPGAGPRGGEYKGVIAQFDSTTKVVVYPGFSRDIDAGTNIYIDHVSQVSAVPSNITMTLAAAPSRVVTAAPCQLFAAFRTASENDFNFENVSGDFKPGTRTQQVPAHVGGAPSASYIKGLGTGLNWHSDFAYSGGASSTIVSSTAGGGLGLSASAAREIDRAKVVIEFPAGLICTDSDGDNHSAVAEFQIYLRYKKNSTASTITELVVGRADSTFGSDATWQGQGADNNRNTQNARRGTVVAKTRGNFFVEYIIDLQEFQPLHEWSLEIKRCTPEEDDVYIEGAVGDPGREFSDASFTGIANIKSVEAQILDKFTYPNSAYAVTTFSAQDFPQPPGRAFHIRGKKIKVPTNYITREELNRTSPLSTTAKYTRHKDTGVDTNSYVTWNGTFRGNKSTSIGGVNYEPTYCNNPAWVFYDILTNKDYGLGEYLEETDIDKFSLYQIARYCDEMVSDSKGGTEPRFTCNVYFQSRTEAFKVLTDLASTFRGMMYWIDGQVVGVQDRPKEPIYTFTAGNVLNGVFSYESTGQKARVNQVVVTWNDPEQMYKKNTLVVDDMDNITTSGKLNSKSVIAFGCTSESQAARVGRWHLLTDTLETEIVKFETSINAGFIRPGDIINIQDARLNAIEFSGRAAASSTTGTINLDRSVVLQSGQNYNLYVIAPEPGAYLQQAAATINSVSLTQGDLVPTDAGGTAITTATAAANLVDDSGNKVFTSFSPDSRLEKRPITTSAGTVTSVTVSPVLLTAPETEAIWAISNVNEYQRTDSVVRYRVASISEEADKTYAIGATKYVYEKFDELERVYAASVPAYRATPTRDEVVPPPTGLRMELIPTPGFDEGSAGAELEVLVSWNEPTEAITDTAGTITTTKYRFIDAYEIDHTFTEDLTDGSRTLEVLSASTTSKSFMSPGGSGTKTVRVRTRNTSGKRSTWASVTQSLVPRQIPAPQFDRSARIVFGGTITSTMSINSSTGLVTIDNTGFKYTSSIGTTFEIVTASGNTKQQAFSGLASGSTGYFYFDASDTSDPWKAMQLHTDSTVENTSGTATSMSYWKEVGASNNGLALVSGTVTSVIGTNTLTGSSTTFSSDFAVGDLIKLSATNTYTEIAGDEYLEVINIASNTSLTTRTNFTKAYASKYAFKQGFKPDFQKDAILGQVTNTSGTYTLAILAIAEGPKGDQGDQGDTGPQGPSGITDLSQLPDGADPIVGSADELIYLDSSVQKRKQVNEITLSQFNNDLTSVPGNFTVSGNFEVSGTTTTVDSTTITVADPLISLAKDNNSSDLLDIGIYGLYDTSGSQDLYSGLFRDANDSGKWKLFKDNQAVPTTTVNTSGTGYAVGTLVANIEGNVTGNTSTVTTNANLTGDVTSVGNATTIATDAVDIAMLSATGTAGNSTFLRGDNTWSAAGTGTVDTSGSPVDNDFAKFTDANTIEGRSYAEVRSDLSVADITGTINANEYARFTDGDTIHARTPAEVLSDISAAASSHSHSYDNYGSWTAHAHDNAGYTITSGDILKFAEGSASSGYNSDPRAIKIDFSADDVLTFSHRDVSQGIASPVGDLTPLGTAGEVTLLASVSHVDGHVTGATTATLTFDGKVEINTGTGALDIKADSITAEEINATEGNFGKIVADIGFFDTLDTDVLNSALVTTRTLQVGSRTTATALVNEPSSPYNSGGNDTVTIDNISGTIAVGDIIRNLNNADAAGIADGTYPTVDEINGAVITMSANQTLLNNKGLYFVTGAGLPEIDGSGVPSGTGCIIKDDGDFFVGNYSANKYMYWDQTGASLTIRGTLNASDISAGTIGAAYISADAITAGSLNGMNFASYGSGTGSGNATVGIGTSITIGNNVVAIGGGAGGSGNQTTSIGNLALNSSTGLRNTALGASAGQQTTSGTYNIAIGSYCMTALAGPAKTGHYNIGIGDIKTLGVMTSGSENIAIGTEAGCDITTGSKNILIGMEAGDNITEGDGNIIIGNVNADSTTGDRQLKIAGNDGSTTTTWLSGDSSGNITAGTIIATTQATNDDSTKVATTAWVNNQSYGAGSGDISRVNITAGTGLTGTVNTASGDHTQTLAVTGLTTTEIAAGSLQLGSESFSDSDSVLMTAAAVQDKIEAYGYSTTAGDITGVTAGSGLSGGGTSGTVTLSHSDTSSQASVDNSGRTYIQDITLDTYGHITAITSATETVTDTNTWRGIDDTPVNGQTAESITSNWAYDHTASATAHGTFDNYSSWTIQDGDSTTYTVTSGDTLQIAEGTYIDSNFTADDVLTISHTDTSSQASVNNSGRTYIQDITLDGAGHVTGLASATETVTNSDTNYYLTGLAISAGKLITATVSGASNPTLQLPVGIADNNLVEIDSGSVAQYDYARFTTTGLQGLSASEVKSHLNLEIGTDVAAQSHSHSYVPLAGNSTKTGSLTIDYTGNGTDDGGLTVLNDASDWGIKIDKDGTATYGMTIRADGDHVLTTYNSSDVEKFRIDGDGDVVTAGTITWSGGGSAAANTATTTANAALPKAGGAMTGAITTNSTFDGIDIAVRDGVLTSTTTTANAALPKAGGTMTGNLVVERVIGAYNSTGGGIIRFFSDDNVSVMKLGNESAPYTGYATSFASYTPPSGAELLLRGIDGICLGVSRSGAKIGLRVASGGNVGINSTAPNHRLLIRGDDNVNTSMFALQTKQINSGSYQEIFSVNPTGSSNNDGMMKISDAGTTKIYFAANSTRGGDSYINSTGGGSFSVGAATAQDGAKFYANGSIQTSSGVNMRNSGGSSVNLAKISGTENQYGSVSTNFASTVGLYTHGSARLSITDAGAVSVTGTFSAVGDITASTSDIRFKTNKGRITNALDKVCSLTGFYYTWNDLAKSKNINLFKDDLQVGVSAQEVQKVMPEVIKPAPIDEDYLTVQYEKLVPLLIESIKELKAEVDALKAKLEDK